MCFVTLGPFIKWVHYLDLAQTVAVQEPTREWVITPLHWLCMVAQWSPHCIIARVATVERVLSNRNTHFIASHEWPCWKTVERSCSECWEIFAERPLGECWASVLAMLTEIWCLHPAYQWCHGCKFCQCQASDWWWSIALMDWEPCIRLWLCAEQWFDVPK